jgi:amidase
MLDLIHQSARALAEAIRDKKVSSLEVVTACIARIQAVNPSLNAVVQTTFEQAIDQAQQADADLSRGVIQGPLHGVPMTIKDSLDTAGVITTAGTKGRANYIPDEDATVVARLRAAGAILVGKTNTPELTLAALTDNYVYGRTNNPYDLARTPGGSSGGAAAIIATGGIPFDIGSDTGGSIRLPSHCCGIAGIKPTAGRVPRTGHIISYDSGFLEPLTHIGPLARYVQDLVHILSIISGADWNDPAVAPVPLGDPMDVPLQQLRVAYYSDNGISAPTGDTKQAIEHAVDVLSADQITLVEDRPPDIEQALTLFDSLNLADGGESFHEILRRSGTELGEIHPSLDWMEAGQLLPTLEFADLIAEWNLYRSRMLAFLKGYDAILCPVSASPAPRHEDAVGLDYSYTCAFNLTGWPSAVVRSGTSTAGLPIGVQIVAPPWREDIALALAEQIEKGLGGWQPPSI